MKSNFEIKSNEAIVRINKNIYPKEVLIQTAYVMLEEFYFFIDEDENYFIVSMRFKEESQNKISEKDVFRLFDELIESQSYLDQLKRTSKIRETILERALLGQSLGENVGKKIEIREKRKKEKKKRC